MFSLSFPLHLSTRLDDSQTLQLNTLQIQLLPLPFVLILFNIVTMYPVTQAKDFRLMLDSSYPLQVSAECSHICFSICFILTICTSTVYFRPPSNISNHAFYHELSLVPGCTTMLGIPYLPVPCRTTQTSSTLLCDVDLYGLYPQASLPSDFWLEVQ